jgi:hypothetical protein
VDAGFDRPVGDVVLVELDGHVSLHGVGLWVAYVNQSPTFWEIVKVQISLFLGFYFEAQKKPLELRGWKPRSCFIRFVVASVSEPRQSQ